MTLTEQSEHPDWALGASIRAKAQLGTYLETGASTTDLAVTLGSGSLGSGQGALEVQPGTGQVHGETHTIGSPQSVDIAGGDSLPRRDVVSLTAQGTITVTKGDPAPTRWASELDQADRTMANAYSPAPPDMHATAGLVLATVFVSANAGAISEGAIEAVRVPAPNDGHASVGDDGSGQVFGVTYLRDEMGGAAVRNAINSAPRRHKFVVEPGATWRIPSTLSPAPSTAIEGYATNESTTRGVDHIFKRGFSGALIETADDLVLRDVSFSGRNAADGHTGPIVRGGGRAQRWDNVTIQDTDSNSPGWEMHIPYICEFDLVHIGDCGIGLDYHHTGSSHHGQNQWNRLWVNRCGTGIRYAQPAKDETYITPTINKCDVAIECDVTATNLGTWVKNIRFSEGNLSDDGVVWLQRAGNSSSVVFQNCQFNGDHSGAPSGLTSPVGLIHIAGGVAGIALDGGFSDTNADSHLYAESASGSTNHQLVIDGAGIGGGSGSGAGTGGGVLTGDISGTNTLLTMQNAAIHDGAISVKSGIGLDPSKGATTSY